MLLLLHAHVFLIDYNAIRLSLDKNIVSIIPHAMASIYLNLPRTVQIALDGCRLMFISPMLCSKYFYTRGYFVTGI